ncbi:MAG: amidohydrolase, partial [Ruminococcaceae bacterium]|nr:amidohydrolase [Oscillospiraceae bacterium]
MEQQKVSLILKNCYLITMDTERRIFENGAVAIQNDKIAAVGKESDIMSAYTADEVYDCQGGVVHPGLIDAHEHVAWHLMRCIVPDNFTVDEVWEKYENPITNHFTGV